MSKCDTTDQIHVGRFDWIVIVERFRRDKTLETEHPESTEPPTSQHLRFR